jgi:hypothetical protein
VLSDDDIHRLAAVQLVAEEDVRAFVAEHAGEEAARRLPMRFQPQGQLTDPDKVFWIPLPVLEPDGVYVAVGFMFGHDDPDEMLAWKPRWHACRGPMAREELEAL